MPLSANNATFISDYIEGTSAVQAAGLEVEIWDDNFQVSEGKVHWCKSCMYL